MRTKNQGREGKASPARLREQRYADDAIASFDRAQLNAPLAVVNGAIALAYLPTERPPPQLPTLPMVGEFGKKYQVTLQTGAVLGLLVVTGNAPGVIARLRAVGRRRLAPLLGGERAAAAVTTTPAAATTSTAAPATTTVTPVASLYEQQLLHTFGRTQQKRQQHLEDRDYSFKVYLINF